MDSNKKSKSVSTKSIYISSNGPYLVSNLPLDEAIIVFNKNGEPIDWERGKAFEQTANYALCRCGKSKNKPFCSGEHSKSGFDGTETFSKEKFLASVEKTIGEELILLDNRVFCNSSNFCTVGKGVWDLTRSANNKKTKDSVVKQICDCPTGRLVVLDKKTNKPLEPDFKESISLITESSGDGAIWVKGGVQIKSSNGTEYEKRNRVCLCRCGKSKNKPFCDGTHLE